MRTAQRHQLIFVNGLKLMLYVFVVIGFRAWAKESETKQYIRRRFVGRGEWFHQMNFVQRASVYVEEASLLR